MVRGKVGDSGRGNIAQDGGMAGGAIRLFLSSEGGDSVMTRCPMYGPGLGGGMELELDRALRRLYLSSRTSGRSDMSGIASGMLHVTLGAEEAGTFLITG